MRNATRVVMAAFIFGAAFFAAAQMPPPPPRAGENPQKAYLDGLREQSPELYNYMKRLEEIQKETQEILESFAKKEIDRETAKAKLLALVEEQQKIQQSPDFIVEQQLLGASMRGQPPGRPSGMPPPRPPTKK